MAGKKKGVSSPLESAIRNRLKQAGLKATQPRILVYCLLKEIGGHRSVDQIVTLLAAQGQEVSRMSVYNVVADLHESSLVMCADAGPGRALYEVSDTWHHHFVCRGCGAVQDVPCAVGKKPCLKTPETFSGQVDEAQVIFRGWCAACTPKPDSYASSGRSNSPKLQEGGKGR